MKEEWRDVVSYEGLYEVSDHGGLRGLVYGGSKRKTPRKLNPSISRSGKSRIPYCCTSLSKNGKTTPKKIHRLVLEAFVGECPNGCQCAHADGNSLNNHIDNLRWATVKDNCQDRKLHGRQGLNAKLTEEDVLEIRQLANTITRGKLAEIYNVSRRNIRMVVNKRTWRHI